MRPFEHKLACTVGIGAPWWLLLSEKERWLSSSSSV